MINNYNNKNVKLIKKDCGEYSAFNKLIDYKFDSVIHLAGVNSVEASFDDSVRHARSNIISTLNLLKFINKKKL